MCHLSPTVHLAWAVLTCGLLVFLVQHLWRYDRFNCLAWSGGKQSGTFKRVMTYSYITSVPALGVYTVSMAILKYRNGYSNVSGHGIVPTPFQLWPKSDQVWLQPLYIIFGIVWGLEIVTHLEELMFWLFLFHQGPYRRNWFASIEFRIWATGSCIGMAGLPLTAILKRNDPLKAEAYLFLVGSLSSLTITALFFIVLAEFPKFLRRVKKEGAATPVILRLVKFHELNIIRVIFRLFMVVPLIVLGVDGVHGHHIINENVLWTDLLAFLAAVGTIISSTMTLLIFFPRSLAEDSIWCPRSVEVQSHHATVSASGMSRLQKLPLVNMRPNHAYLSRRIETLNSFDDNQEPGKSNLSQNASRSPRYYSGMTGISPNPLTTPYYPPKSFAEETYSFLDSTNQWPVSPASAEKTSRRLSYVPSDQPGNIHPTVKIRLMELGEVIDKGMRRPSRPPRLHPYITSFISPIDLPSSEEDLVPRAI